MRTTEKIMGVPVDNITYEDILADLPRYLNSSKKMTAISVNPQIILEGHTKPEIIQFIKESTHRIPDGIGIVLVSKITGGKIKDRVAGIELMNRFLKYANDHEKSAFFYGSRPEVLKDALINIQSDYPQLKIAGSIDGYTKLSEEDIVIRINLVKPDFVFVALGFPRQEEWICRNLTRIDASIFQDVGGSFDVLSGHVNRAPKFFIDHHLEWLYRSVSSPKRLGRILQLPIFVVKSLWWKIKGER